MHDAAEHSSTAHGTVLITARIPGRDLVADALHSGGTRPGRIEGLGCACSTRCRCHACTMSTWSSHASRTERRLACATPRPPRPHPTHPGTRTREPLTDGAL